jgi:hypothetical protein
MVSTLLKKGILRKRPKNSFGAFENPFKFRKSTWNSFEGFRGGKMGFRTARKPSKNFRVDFRTLRNLFYIGFLENEFFKSVLGNRFRSGLDFRVSGNHPKSYSTRYFSTPEV